MSPMFLERSRREVTTLIWKDSTTSTNDDLLALGADLDDFSTLVAAEQTAGRGRLGRVWAAPAGASLAISVLVTTDPSSRRTAPLEWVAWLPIAAGIAMVDAVAGLLPQRSVAFKWPNDVQIDERKVCGILCEFAPGGGRIVIGAGLNLFMTSEQLPVASATSLALSGVAVDSELADRVLASYLHGLRRWVDELRSADGDAETSGLRSAALSRCTTLGRQVRVELPGDTELRGTAIDVDAGGRLLVKRASDGRVVPVAAGDVTHVR